MFCCSPRGRKQWRGNGSTYQTKGTIFIPITLRNVGFRYLFSGLFIFRGVSFRIGCFRRFPNWSCLFVWLLCQTRLGEGRAARTKTAMSSYRTVFQVILPCNGTVQVLGTPLAHMRPDILWAVRSTAFVFNFDYTRTGSRWAPLILDGSPLDGLVRGLF